ncbi:hypothetical protein LH464_22555 [Neorhizobium sp. T786]|uniref:hypothetical protein n=1 Tax=Pseudorhizobium xiangyangii TaxID=2883104 RepID=UPI001D000DD3|nr:hypothetical protein [Neorhizobium xiangyangii]MCB5205250.1 hypothetical protein [Neorhizobium xiangyangii]
MKPILAFAIAVPLSLLVPQPSNADCADVTKSANKQAKTGISKDGSHAPMESETESQAQPGPAEGTTTTSSDTAAKSPEKDGSNMPLGEASDIATSGQDAEAQQQGAKTAAAAAQKC